MGIHPGHRLSSGADYVLTPFRRSQLDHLNLDAWLDDAADAAELVLKEGVAGAMNRYNRKPDTGDEPK